MNPDAPKIYVGTFGKYNSGSIAGAWFDLSQYDSQRDFLVDAEKLHDDEHDPELMFQDWEYLPSNMVGDSWVSPEVWDLIKNYPWAAVVAFSKLVPDFESDWFKDAYVGQWESLQAYADALGVFIGKLELDGFKWVDGFIFQDMRVDDLYQ